MVLDPYLKYSKSVIRRSDKRYIRYTFQLLFFFCSFLLLVRLRSDVEHQQLNLPKAWPSCGVVWCCDGVHKTQRRNTTTPPLDDHPLFYHVRRQRLRLRCQNFISLFCSWAWLSTISAQATDPRGRGKSMANKKGKTRNGTLEEKKTSPIVGNMIT